MTVATKMEQKVEPEITPGKVYWLIAQSRLGNGAIEPGDSVRLEVREPKPGDYVWERIGSGWFAGQVWRSRTRGLCIALFRADGTYNKRYDSTPIIPDTVFLVATGQLRML